jgi:ATP-dependent DNA helicase RecQ
MELMSERFEHMLNYISSEDLCRNNIIESYFSNSKSEPCGICDNCLAKKRQDRKSESSNISTQIIDQEIIMHAQEGNMDIRQICEQIRGNQDLIIERFKHLINEGVIELSSIDGMIRKSKR